MGRPTCQKQLRVGSEPSLVQPIFGLLSSTTSLPSTVWTLRCLLPRESSKQVKAFEQTGPGVAEKVFTFLLCGLFDNSDGKPTRELPLKLDWQIHPGVESHLFLSSALSAPSSPHIPPPKSTFPGTPSTSVGFSRSPVVLQQCCRCSISIGFEI